MKSSVPPLLTDSDRDLLAASPLFDGTWYASRYPDVADSGLSPLEHFLRVGARLGRDPGPSFSMSGYLARHRDVARAGLNPLVHFERYGRAECRDTGVPRSAEAAKSESASGIAVDVIVPVYNALEDVRTCLESLARVPTARRTRVFVINDGSDEETTAWLRSAVRTLGTTRVAFQLIEHEVNRGYTIAVNTGLRVSRAPFVVTLNSDTIVTPFWLDGLIRCLTSDPRIGIAGPLSNAASWQNVPTLLAEDGSFAINALPQGVTPAIMAKLVSLASQRCYPRTPFVNGFCYMIRREVISRIGFMDEQAFPTGYGEENDFSIRARDAGFALAVADDTYVFHAKSKSFGTERRIALSKAGSQALKAKHSAARIAALLVEVKDTRALDAVRARIAHALEHFQEPVGRTGRDWLVRSRILFILPASPGGGGVHSVVQEVAAMRRMGVDAKVAVKAEQAERFRQSYGDIPNIDDIIVGITPTNLVTIASRFDVVVATIFKSVSTVASIVRACPWILPAYYVQDYEPLFFEPGSEDWKEAHASYGLIPEAVLFAKTDWICREVEREHGVAVHKVLASIDHDIYHPAPKRPRADGHVVIAAMVRPRTPRRAPGRTMELLRRLKNAYGERVSLRIFGCTDDSPEFQELPRDFEFENQGVLTRPQVAALLRETDIFIDLSDYQAFGRTALEAMACGAVALVPAAGGADEFAQDGVNALVMDTRDLDACYRRVAELLDDCGRMEAMQFAALGTAAKYSPHRAAVSELLVLAPELATLRERVGQPRRTRLTLVPALTASRGPGARSIAGSGFVRLVQPYSQGALAGPYEVTISSDGRLPLPGTADLVVLQRDLIEEVRQDFEDWQRRFRDAGGRIIYEIDDDLLDSQGLVSHGYREDPQALAERVRAYAEAADIITVSTSTLADRLSDFSRKVRVVPNYIDERLWSLGGHENTGGRHARPKLDGQVRIGYMGTPSHRGDLELIHEAMLQIQARYGKSVDIEVVGAFQDGDALFGFRKALPRKNAYPEFVDWIQEVAAWDIAIVPLAENHFNMAKSSLKFMETAALGSAIVCSDVPVYRDVARNEENCLLAANTTTAWTEALSRLIEDAALRRRLAENARREVAVSHTVQRHEHLYLSVLSEALGAAR